MILKILVTATIIFALAFSFFFIYNNLPLNPIKLVTEKQEENFSGVSSYVTTPVFAENMRFRKNEVSYWIRDSCISSQILRMEKAFEIFNEEIEFVFLYEIEDENKADITISCLESEVEIGKNLFAVGEGGPTKFIKVGEFSIIEKGNIYLYKESKCDYPVVELHELFHVFGFDHSENSRNVMYPTYNCNQRITPDMISFIKELYSLESLPNAKITELNVIKKGRYLDFNISVSNEGLSDIKNISLTILSQEREIGKFYLDGINIGYTKTLRVTNLRIPLSIKMDVLDFYVDYENSIRELDKTNNYARVYSP